MFKTMTYFLIILIASLIIWSVWGFLGSRVEQTEYTVLQRMNGYEIREYPAHIVAQTLVNESQRNAMNSGFSIVAGYIFGGNTKKEKIAMTAPVVARNNEDKKESEKIAMTAPVVATSDGDFQIISFSMPRSYSMETLPTPTDPRVKIVMVPFKKYAVMRYSWFNSDDRVKSMQQKLQMLLSRDKILSVGSFAYAGYNAPGTPPWMIRNEVLVEIQ